MRVLLTLATSLSLACASAPKQGPTETNTTPKEETPADPAAKLQEGDPAPDFTIAAHDGSTVTMSKLRGHHVVLYFYPKDETPG